MSLMSYITNSTSQTGYGSSLTSLLGTTATSATTATTTAAATAATSGSNSATISTAAIIAAAEAADNKKDFTTLSNDVRSALDAAAKASGTTKPDLSEMSGRALSAIILNKTGAFTNSEQTAAKAELNARTRNEMSDAISSGSSMTALTSYNQLLISEYDSMSPEERQARGWTSAIRTSAANFVSATTASANGTNSSLFDLLNDSDDGSGSTGLF